VWWETSEKDMTFGEKKYSGQKEKVRFGRLGESCNLQKGGIVLGGF